ncbi:putative VIP1-actin cytoskeleton organization and biogenesis-related protein [Meira miltonrushii]|uniref:Inositol hexakisphosphate and diphosphoinositol-pentakisphosphate kinase n=1 Tax=Meira miltonrushii TaxID=1280837 RepID=A0A316V9K4_9BASI|nr:putative VIP1-actin cytoskeleton organization and biogenesis-related protein [Meira miltonrushii]PWN34277.1 putative VIP1-actin cytoskeleton organization and biogenesis-related protein [Meira miltonrushii]
MANNATEPILLGVAARDRKARSKPMSQILNRILNNPEINCQIVNFGDKVLLDEPPESWPVVDVLISFFSDGFPLDKAIAYADLRKPVLVNDLRLQKVLWDRRAVLAILDAVKVPTPRRLEVDRDGGPEVEEKVFEDLKKRLKLDLRKGRQPSVECKISEDDIDTLIITKTEQDGKVNTTTMKKPFVEKPVSGEDHNIHIYFPKSRGGGGRRLFRKVGNKSSEYDAELIHPRGDGSYIYEEFMDVDNAEDVKVYTIGPHFVHAETRKSPVVDGMVKRNPDGKEIRYITKLTDEEVQMATNISNAFKQNICGFDLLRVGKKSYVIDVNGWSFVKGNDFYYDNCAEILSKFCKVNVPRPLNQSRGHTPTRGGDQEQASWTLKANVTVFRHGDRTPKQKLKRSFKPKEKWAKPLLDLLQGRREEIILRNNLEIISQAAQKAMEIEGANVEDLKLVIQLIERKKNFGGTKVQIKPSFDKKSGELEKMQLIIKWGGEFSHAARHQAKDFGQNMRRDMVIMNDAALKNCTIYTSSERRVTASAEIFAASFLEEKADPSKHPLELIIRKDLLDDSNAAKDWMDVVKKDLKHLLRPEVGGNDKPTGWPEDLDGPSILCSRVSDLLKELRSVMRSNWNKIDVERVQMRWCTHETPALFRERWEKLFADYEEDPYDPGRTSELYDMLCHDGLHNRQFFETIFTNPEDKTEDRLRTLQDLYRMSMALFNYICPREYGITTDQKARIGLLTSMPLLEHIIGNLRASDKSSLCSLYFTKESHIHTLLNLILASDLPIVMPSMPPLDYFSSITFEVFEKTVAPSTSTNASPRDSVSLQGSVDANNGGSSTTASSENGTPMRSLLISLSEGAHSDNILSVNVDARHALTPLPRRPLTTHIDLDEALNKLGAHSTTLDHLDAPIERGQVEGGAVFFGEQDSETGVLPVKQRRSSTDTDQTTGI